MSFQTHSALSLIQCRLSFDVRVYTLAAQIEVSTKPQWLRRVCAFRQRPQASLAYIAEP